MNVLRTKKVSHVGNRDDHGQPIAGGDGQRCQTFTLRPERPVILCYMTYQWSTEIIAFVDVGPF